jgi:threonine synthase
LDWQEHESLEGLPAVILETAKPAKFPEEIEKMRGWSPAIPPTMEAANKRPEDFDRMNADYETFKTHLIAQHN